MFDPHQTFFCVHFHLSYFKKSNKMRKRLMFCSFLFLFTYLSDHHPFFMLNVLANVDTNCNSFVPFSRCVLVFSALFMNSIVAVKSNLMSSFHSLCFFLFFAPPLSSDLASWGKYKKKAEWNIKNGMCVCLYKVAQSFL